MFAFEILYILFLNKEMYKPNKVLNLGLKMAEKSAFI